MHTSVVHTQAVTTFGHFHTCLCLALADGGGVEAHWDLCVLEVHTYARHHTEIQFDERAHTKAIESEFEMQLTTTEAMLAHIVVQKLWAGASIGYADVQKLGEARVVLFDALEGEEGEYAVVQELEVPRPVEELVVPARVLDQGDVLCRPQFLMKNFFSFHVLSMGTCHIASRAQCQLAIAKVGVIIKGWHT